MRRFARYCGIVLLTLVSLGSQAALGEQVSGVVFLDANANGRRDAGEAGVAGAFVTDGMSFAATNAEGRYALDAQTDPLVGEGKRPILTLTLPSGTWPTAGWMQRLDAAADPQSVDFGLRRQEHQSPFIRRFERSRRANRSAFPCFIAKRPWKTSAPLVSAAKARRGAPQFCPCFPRRAAISPETPRKRSYALRSPGPLRV